MPNSFTEFPDFASLKDRQLTLLLLYEISEARAEIRALTSVFLSTVGKDVSSEKLNEIANRIQDDVIGEMIKHAEGLLKPAQRPPLN
jgi:hypothetical protein